MKKWICLLIACLFLAGIAHADESSADVMLDVLQLQLCECGLTAQSDGAEITFRWVSDILGDAAGVYLMDVGRAAVSNGTVDSWQMIAEPMEETNIAMVLLGAAKQEMLEQGTLRLSGDISFPLQIAFQIDFYEDITKSAYLDLRQQRWRLVRSEENEQLVEARPDLPHLNDNSNTPQVLTDFDALVIPGASWEEQLDYQREHARLKRLVAKTYALAKHLKACEVLITFDSPDQPGIIQITELD